MQGKFIVFDLSLKFLIYTLILLSVSSSAFANQQSVHSYQLPNGLQLFVKEDHRLPIVMSQVWYKVGSGYEPSGVSGISHVLEHMMFQGTAKYGANEYTHILQENGGLENAFTSRDYTAYYSELPAKILYLDFKLEADRMQNLSLDSTLFKRELQVVMEERRTQIDDNPFMMTLERLMAEAYISTPYHHLPIGWMSDLENLTLDDLSSWYREWYVPNNALLVVVGDVIPDQVYQLAMQYFGSLKPGKLPVIKPQPGEAALGMRTAIVKLPAGSPWLIQGYRVPSLKSDSNNHDPYALVVIEWILNGGQHNRFEEELVINQQVATNLKINYDPFTRLSSLFKITGTPTQNHSLDQLQQAIFAELKKLQEKPVDAQELRQVVVEVTAEHVYSQDSLMAQAKSIGSLEIVGLPWQLSDEYVKQISLVTPEEIQAVAKRYFSVDNLTEARLQPLPPSAKQKLMEPPTSLGIGSVH